MARDASGEILRQFCDGTLAPLVMHAWHIRGVDHSTAMPS